MDKIRYIEVRITVGEEDNSSSADIVESAYTVVPPMGTDTARAYLFGIVQPLFHAVVRAVEVRLPPDGYEVVEGEGGLPVLRRKKAPGSSPTP